MSRVQTIEEIRFDYSDRSNYLNRKATTMQNVAELTIDNANDAIDSDFQMMLNEEKETERGSWLDRHADDMRPVIVQAYEQHAAYMIPLKAQQAKEAELAERFKKNAQQKMLTSLTADETPAIASSNVKTLSLQALCDNAPVDDTDDSDEMDEMDDTDETDETNETDILDYDAIIANSDSEAKSFLEEAKVAQEALKHFRERAKQAKELAKMALTRAQAAKIAQPVVITDEIAQAISKVRSLACADEQTIAKALMSGLLKSSTATKSGTVRTTSGASSDSKGRGQSLVELHRPAIYAGIEAGKGDTEIGRELGISGKVCWHGRQDYKSEDPEIRHMIAQRA